MKKISFTKMVASGNDFIVCENQKLKTDSLNLSKLSQSMCDRKFGIGADGLLILGKSKIANIKMRVFNSDGSEANMCGNGARCIAAYFFSEYRVLKTECLRIETKAGIIEAQINAENVKIKLTDPKDIKLDIPIKINDRLLRVNFINTGVPHAVISVQGLDKVDVLSLGRKIRCHQKFAPEGTNVNFVEVLNNNSLKVRTYERGVEGETLACGTGSAAAALLTAYNLQLIAKKINVYTQSGEVLKVYFKRIINKFSDVWLEGKARIVCKGEYYV
jgi:diaminopimelate epimerase